jgi:hypothetical protein
MGNEDQERYTMAQIAAALGLSWWAIWWHLRDHAIPAVYETDSKGRHRVFDLDQVMHIFRKTRKGKQWRSVEAMLKTRKAFGDKP